MEKKGKQKGEGLFLSASAVSIAKAMLASRFGKDASEIIRVMEEAARSDSTRKKLERIRLALMFLREGGAR